MCRAALLLLLVAVGCDHDSDDETIELTVVNAGGEGVNVSLNYEYFVEDIDYVPVSAEFRVEAGATKKVDYTTERLTIVITSDSGVRLYDGTISDDDTITVYP